MPAKVEKNIQDTKAPAADKRQVKTGQEKIEKKGKGVVKKEKTKRPKDKRKNLSVKWWLKDIVLAVVNLIFLLSLVVILGRLPQRANEFKQLRSTYVLEIEKSKIEVAEMEIESGKRVADELSDLFPDEAGLADFAKEMDTLKEEGLISGFIFASEQAVRDKTGSLGVPVVIRLRGSWILIGEGLAKIEELPFILRAVSIETEKIDEESVIDFKYGGFLYVDESFAKN